MKWLRFSPILVIVGIIVYLIATSFTGALTYYVTASEFHKNTSKYADKSLKIAGWVQKDSIKRHPKNPLNLQFLVRESGVLIPVRFNGIVPDTFKDDAEVVVTGRWTGQHFQATELLAKCASKYSEKLPEQEKPFPENK